MHATYMSQNLILSIITVCKNARSTIEATLQSVRMQSYPRIEHVVIGGASTDGTADIVRSYGGVTLISEPDSGLYNAMNKGVRLASGDILYFLNANDRFYDSRVCARIIDEFVMRPHVDILHGDIMLVTADGERIWRSNRFKTDVDLMRQTIQHQCIFYRRKVLDTCGGYDESYPIAADTELLFRALRTFSFRKGHVPLTIALFPLGGVSTSRDPRTVSAIRRENRRMTTAYLSPLERIYGNLRSPIFFAGRAGNKIVRVAGRAPSRGI